MRRFTALILMLCLAFSGCSAIREGSYNPGQRPTANALPLEATGRTMGVTLYFLKGDRLESEFRDIVVTGDNVANAIMAELAAGSRTGLSPTIPAGTVFSDVEVTGDCANVYLRAALLPGDRERLIAHASIASTLVGALSVKYVNVYYNDLCAGVYGVPTGAFTTFGGSVDDALAQYRSYAPLEKPAEEPLEPAEDVQPVEDVTEATEDVTEAEDVEAGDVADGVEMEGEPPPVREAGAYVQLPITLYFAAPDDVNIVAQTRVISCELGGLVSAVIDELIKGPTDNSLRSPLSRDTALASPPVITEGEGGSRLVLDFAVYPRYYQQGSPLRDYQTAAALVHTLCGAIPGVSEVDIRVGGKTVATPGRAGDAFAKSDFEGVTANICDIYLAHEVTGLIMAARRTFDSDGCWSAAARLDALLAGPIDGDDPALLPIVPADITGEDILGVEYSGSTVQVNVSSRFKAACARLGPEDEAVLIYAIVNTLSSLPGVNDVAFVVEGKAADLGPSIYTRAPILPNPGRVKE